jgi:hypothetical protein
MQFLDKEIKVVVTQGFDALYGGLEATLYIKTAMEVLRKYPVDMLIFEMPDDEHFQVRLAGYNFNTDKLDEKTVAFKTKSLKIETFWFKVDDYEDHYVGTFLMPSEY